ncbi:MAG: bifunctional sulfate adenylyltransferase/adenylylsulfate kinase [Planctomycetota bacterium]|nr:bifunctional sulfate adenylyltransferase/adenylylsulfate kinase [Planctomycetota bacterium]
MGADTQPPSAAPRDLYAGPSEAEALKQEATSLPSFDLAPHQVSDLELLLNGGYSPLLGFQGPAEVASVLERMRLPSGALWPLPVTLDVTEAFASTLGSGDRIALRDPEGILLAVMDVEAMGSPDLPAQLQALFGTTDETHPGVRAYRQDRGPVRLGGPVRGVEAPTHHDFVSRRHSPAKLRERFETLGWRRIVAFQPYEPVHRAEFESVLRAATKHAALLLLHPLVGSTTSADLGHVARVRCYEHLLTHAPEASVELNLLDLAPRQGGPREALWHALIHKNHGCTHILVGQDSTVAARELLEEHAVELGIGVVRPEELVYREERDQYVPANEATEARPALATSESEALRRLASGEEVPPWFSYPEIVAELQASSPPRERQGFTVFFTGLSGSGKSTIANALRAKLLARGGRHVTLLDGDLVRKNLSSELGFSKAHRDLNIRRIGWVASEITRHGGIAICAPIAPYAATRRDVRGMIEPLGGFLEVHVATPLAVCEARDRKGLYAQARAGLIKEFTGISDPYEEPQTPELRIDTQDVSAERAAEKILAELAALGFLRPG